MAAVSALGSQFATITVGSSATEVINTDTSGDRGNPRQILVHNEDTADIFLGFSSSVTTANGMPLAPGEKLSFDFNFIDELFAISAAGSADLRYMILHGRGGQ